VSIAPADAHEAIQLELPAQRAYNAVGRLVVGGVAARLDFEVAEIEDLQLAVEALLCRPPAQDVVTLTLQPADDELHARLGPFVARGDRERVERMLLRLVRKAVVQDADGCEWIVILATRARTTARGSS
jgi:hypothetical protein